MTRRRPEFGSGKAGAEAAKLEKFSAGVPNGVSPEGVGCRRIPKSAAVRRSLGALEERFVFWGMAQAEPILESRAVYPDKIFRRVLDYFGLF